MTTADIRVPLVAGIDAGVGTSTLAAALHARDGGVLAQEADVVVCAATEESLRAAAVVACPGSGPRPVLVVTGGPLAVPVPPAIRTRYCSVVELPRIDDWAAGVPAADAAVDVLGVPPDRLSAPLRSYAEALQALVSALMGGGVLAASGPPMVIRPRAVDPWRGTHRPTPPHPTHPTRPPTPAAPPQRDETRSRPAQPDETHSRPRRPNPTPSRAALDENHSRPAELGENRSRPRGVDEGGSRPEGRRADRTVGAGERAPRQAGPARTTRPPRRTADVRSVPSRPHRCGQDEDDDSIEARNLAADRRPAARGRAG